MLVECKCMIVNEILLLLFLYFVTLKNKSDTHLTSLQLQMQPPAKQPARQILIESSPSNSEPRDLLQKVTYKSDGIQTRKNATTKKRIIKQNKTKQNKTQTSQTCMKQNRL